MRTSRQQRSFFVGVETTCRTPRTRHQDPGTCARLDNGHVPPSFDASSLLFLWLFLWLLLLLLLLLLLERYGNK